MKQAYREMAGIMTAGIVMVFLLVFAAGSALLPKLGQEMDIPGTEYRGYQDFAQTKSVCSRKPPKIVRKGSWRWNEGEEIGIGRIFQGTDAERGTAG